MANVKFSANQWDKAKEYYEAGVKLTLITEKTGIDFSAISRKAKKENWKRNNDNKQDLINQAAMIEVAKSELSKNALIVHDELVDERMQQIKFFNTMAIKNVMEAMEMPCITQQDFKFRSETISKGREVVLGKTPDTAVQVNLSNNGVKGTLYDLADMSDDDLMREINALDLLDD